VETLPAPQVVLDFWFGELQPGQWFIKDEALDATIRGRFGSLLDAFSSDGVPSSWLDTARNRLAAVIVLDQFPRNIHRDRPEAFATDAAALALARETLALELDRQLSEVERKFLYMPYQHAEDAAVQAECIALFRELGDERTLAFAQAHKDVIDRFGRFPHRNAILGRSSTADENDYLAQPDAGF